MVEAGCRAQIESKVNSDTGFGIPVKNCVGPVVHFRRHLPGSVLSWGSNVLSQSAFFHIQLCGVFGLVGALPI